VSQRTAIVVAPAVDGFGIFAHPPFQAAFLLGTRDALVAVLGNDGRFEVIGQRKDHMHGTANAATAARARSRPAELSLRSRFVF
jgi:hypothetical protein